MNKLFKLQIGETIFLVAGLLWLASLFLLKNEYGIFVWSTAKVFYFLGLGFFFYNFIFKRKSE